MPRVACAGRSPSWSRRCCNPMKDVTSLEVSRRLKEAGWKQDQGAHYADWGDGKIELNPNTNPNSNEYCERFAASTIGELLEALPKNIEGKYLVITWDDYGWMMGYKYPLHELKSDFYYSIQGSVGQTIQDCLAQLWIALKEKNLV